MSSMITAQDAYIWQVRLEGEAWLLEYDDERPDGRGFLEVEQAKIRAIDLIPTEQGTVKSVLVPQGASPVFLRRRTIEVDPIIGAQSKSTVHCIGWKHGESGCYLFIFEDGSTLLSNDFNAV